MCYAATGKRLARINPVDTHETVDIPALRIIDDELWQQVRARQQTVRFEIGRTEDGNALNRVHRRKFLLSGLLECGCCGGGYTIVGKDRYGCATLRAKGTCANQRTTMRQHIETRVLSGLKKRLLAPELVAEAVRVFADEMAASRKEAAQRRAGQQREMAEVQRSLGGILKAIESGAWSDTLRDWLTELEVRKAVLTAELAQSDDAPIVLHPAAAAAYRHHVQELEAALNDPALRGEAAEVLRV